MDGIRVFKDIDTPARAARQIHQKRRPVIHPNEQRTIPGRTATPLRAPVYGLFPGRSPLGRKKFRGGGYVVAHSVSLI